MKQLLKQVFAPEIPKEILNRRDKMGFPVPLKEWFGDELKEFAADNFNSLADNNRPFINSKAVLNNFKNDAPFSRKSWGLLSMELWHQQFHDKFHEWQAKARHG